jgi:hypothetical protein
MYLFEWEIFTIYTTSGHVIDSYAFYRQDNVMQDAFY